MYGKDPENGRELVIFPSNKSVAAGHRHSGGALFICHFQLNVVQGLDVIGGR